ncbi:MAG: PilX N-terminal domain-containing pilus assembly protein [Xanthomonadales bacterium]|nr:PilX N-terminal domain-containing pilus assembly protein [Xanthomonadales bacterium]
MEVINRSILTRISRRRQAGALTIFTAILVLTLMTLLLLYASRAGILEQRISSNEVRQKLAFHAAESALNYSVEYLMAANARLISKSTEAVPYRDSDGNPAWHAGWFSPGNVRWKACPASPSSTHPCGGSIPTGGTGSLYYDDPATISSNLFPKYDSLPLDDLVAGNLPPNTAIRATAVMCPRTLDNTTCLGTAGIPEVDDEDESEPVKFLLWILAYGYSDCFDDDGDGTFDVPDECNGQAQIARPVGSIENFKGSPTVPLVAANTLPASGTAEVVPNPNGGGEGVPTSIWANSNSSCGPIDPDGTAGETIEVDGAFKTCEMHEWYGQDSRPDDGKCAGAPGQCQCDYPGPEPISYRQSGDTVIGIDVLADDSFPCDLFEFYFGYPKSQYQAVKSAATPIDDCSALNTESVGFFWFSGSTCTLGDVGTINNSVILISAADDLTSINGNASFFGILYVSDVEDPEGDAAFKPGGDATVYGAAIVDVLFDQSGFSGTFRVVYNEAALLGAGGAGSLGGLASGWRDYGLPTVTWEN